MLFCWDYDEHGNVEHGEEIIVVVTAYSIGDEP